MCSKILYFNILLNIIWFKNLDLFVRLIVDVIQKQHIKKHKNLFRHVNNIINTYFIILENNKIIKGYSLYFKGKLGRKGSVKKSLFYKKKGLVSFNNKLLRYNYKNFLINTETGIVGCYISLYYKSVYIYIYIFIILYIYLFIYLYLFNIIF